MKKKRMPKQFRELVTILNKAMDLLIRGARGEYGEGIATSSQAELKKVRRSMTANYARLFETNQSFRKHMMENLSRKELNELMQESLRLNPKKELML